MEIIYIGEGRGADERFYIKNDNDFVSMIWDLLGRDAGLYAQNMAEQINTLELEAEQFEYRTADACEISYSLGYQDGYNEKLSDGLIGGEKT